MYYVRTIQLLKTSEINKQLQNYILNSNISMSKRTIELKQLVNQ